MHIITQAYFLTGIAILLAFVNYHTTKLQPTIGVMLASVCTSLGLLIVGTAGSNYLLNPVIKTFQEIDFNSILMNGLLSFLLFSGALSIDIEFLKKAKIEISTLAFGATLCSTFVLAALLFLILNHVLPYFNLTHFYTLPMSACLLFGALISPTDPIAVIATLKQMKAPKKIETILAGESLFNDGVGIVTFLTLYQVVFSTSGTSAHDVIALFVKQSIGGICFGLTMGIVCIKMVNTIQQDKTLPTLLTIAITTGGYAFSQWLDVSGPLAMVASGIYIAHKCPKSTMNTLHLFWEFIDELLNIILFFLVGFELLLISWNPYLIVVMPIAVALALLARWLTVASPLLIINRFKPQPKNINKILIWGGLRGGLAIALALSIPRSYPYQNLILSMTYAVVLFSILIQGTTVSRFVKKWQS